VSHLFLPISLSLRHLPRHWSSYVVFFSWGCWCPRFFWRRPTNSIWFSLWSASLGLSTGHGCSYRTHSRFSFHYSECLFPGTVQRRYSYLARWWTRSPHIHPVPFFHIFSPFHQCLTTIGSCPHLQVCITSHPHLLSRFPDSRGEFGFVQRRRRGTNDLKQNRPPSIAMCI
jgi:hypothetical protein